MLVPDNVMGFLKDAAGLPKDGECEIHLDGEASCTPECEEYVLENDAAVNALHGLINQARELCRIYAPPSQEEVDRLVAEAHALGLEDVDLDEEVHDAASRSVSDLNNEGIEEQIRFLLEMEHFDNVQARLEDIAAEKGG